MWSGFGPRILTANAVFTNDAMVDVTKNAYRMPLSIVSVLPRAA